MTGGIAAVAVSQICVSWLSCLLNRRGIYRERAAHYTRFAVMRYSVWCRTDGLPVPLAARRLRRHCHKGLTGNNIAARSRRWRASGNDHRAAAIPSQHDGGAALP